MPTVPVETSTLLFARGLIFLNRSSIKGASHVSQTVFDGQAVGCGSGARAWRVQRRAGRRQQHESVYPRRRQWPKPRESVEYDRAKPLPASYGVGQQAAKENRARDGV